MILVETWLLLFKLGYILKKKTKFLQKKSNKFVLEIIMVSC